MSTYTCTCSIKLSSAFGNAKIDHGERTINNSILFIVFMTVTVAMSNECHRSRPLCYKAQAIHIYHLWIFAGILGLELAPAPGPSRSTINK
jgi:hypothetical protein